MLGSIYTERGSALVRETGYDTSDYWIKQYILQKIQKFCTDFEVYQWDMIKKNLIQILIQ